MQRVRSPGMWELLLQWLSVIRGAHQKTAGMDVRLLSCLAALAKSGLFLKGKGKFKSIAGTSSADRL